MENKDEKVKRVMISMDNILVITLDFKNDTEVEHFYSHWKKYDPTEIDTLFHFVMWARAHNIKVDCAVKGFGFYSWIMRILAYCYFNMKEVRDSHPPKLARS